jgi:hypothetical protein
MTYSDKVLLASFLCCGIYGSTYKLKHVLDSFVGRHGFSYDMVFRDILDGNKFLIINHDSLEKNVSINSYANDKNQVLHAMKLGHVFFRHRNIGCPSLSEIKEDNFHILNYEGDCPSIEPYANEIVVSMLDYMIYHNMLKGEHYRNTIRFLSMPSAYQEMASRGAEKYLNKLRF